MKEGIIMFSFKDVKMLKKISAQLPDLINDFGVIKDMDYKNALQYVMGKYKCNLEQAKKIVLFTREHDVIC